MGVNWNRKCTRNDPQLSENGLSHFLWESCTTCTVFFPSCSLCYFPNWFQRCVSCYQIDHWSHLEFCEFDESYSWRIILTQEFWTWITDEQVYTTVEHAFQETLIGKNCNPCFSHLKRRTEIEQPNISQFNTRIYTTNAECEARNWNSKLSILSIPTFTWLCFSQSSKVSETSLCPNRYESFAKAFPF